MGKIDNLNIVNTKNHPLPQGEDWSEGKGKERKGKAHSHDGHLRQPIREKSHCTDD